MGFVWFISGVGLFRLSLAFSRRNSSNSFNLASQGLVSTALIISVAPAWTPSSLSKPFQEGDTDSTQQSNEELTNAGPRGGEDSGAGACHGPFMCVESSQL